MHNSRFRVENLRANFPVAMRQIIKENFGWITLFALLCGVSTYVRSPLDQLSIYPSDLLVLEDPLVGFVVGAFLILTLKCFHSFMLHRALSYRLEGDQLVISKDVLLKKKDMLFIERIVDVYVRRSFLDVLFGLNSVGIVVLGRPDIQIAGLSTAVAARFQRYLVQIVEENSARLHGAATSNTGDLRNANDPIPDQALQEPAALESIHSSFRGGGTTISSYASFR